MGQILNLHRTPVCDCWSLAAPPSPLQISAVRLPREPNNPERLKGFGYAEFDDVESLLRALSLNEEVSGFSGRLRKNPDAVVLCAT